MANTGFDWGTWTTLQNAVVLTQGGTTEDTSSAVSLDVKAGCEVGVAATYSNHAKATAGLSVYLLRTYDGTNYQVAADVPWNVEMIFTQNASNYFVFSVDPAAVGSFKILLSWGNTTASSSVTITTKYRTADIPVAS